jgi:predicted cobalt transporter CbtA
MTTARDLLVRGLLAGLLAGIAAFVVAYAVGEPSVSAAIALEDSSGGHSHGTDTGSASTEDHDHGTAASGHDHGGATEVPRSLQSTLGLATATVVAGVTLGGLIGVVSALALGRFGRLGARGVPLLVAGLGFVAVYLVPFLVYPPNPPAVGSADTIGLRTALYFLLVAISVIAGVAAVLVARRVAPRWGAWWATLVCAAGYVVVVGLASSLMPTYDEVPAGFPASLLYEFRLSSLLVQVVLWGAIGLALAELTHRLAVRGRRVEHAAELVDA